MTKCEISDEDYEHIVTIWRTFRIKNMEDYRDLHLKYVLLLAALFETFRMESINSLELDPAHHLSTPSYSWHVMLRGTGVNLKLSSEIKKYQLLESVMGWGGGGISMICKG